MHKPLSQLLYVSDAVKPMTKAGLESLVAGSKLRNDERDITGLLLYGNCHFMQVLEGDMTGLNELYWRIYHDRRHHHVSLLLFQPIDARSFGNWDMDLINLDDDPALDRRPLVTMIKEAASPTTPSGGLLLRLMDEFGRQLERGGGSSAGRSAAA